MLSAGNPPLATVAVRLGVVEAGAVVLVAVAEAGAVVLVAVAEAPETNARYSPATQPVPKPPAAS